MTNRRRAFIIDFSLFFGACLTFFLPALGDDLIFRDAYHEYLVLNNIWAWLGSGDFPLWAPHPDLGSPLAGAVFTGSFYPLGLAIRLLPGLSATWILKLYTFVHYPIAAFAMAFLAREFKASDLGARVGGLAYALSGFLVSQHYAANLLPAFALMPLALALAARAAGGKTPAAAGAGLVTGIIFLGGDPQGFSVSGLLGGSMILLGVSGAGAAALQRRIPLAAFFGVIAFAAGAAEMVPAWTVFQQSERAAGIVLDDAACWSTNPWRFIEFFLARPFGEFWPKNNFWGEFMFRDERCFPLPLAGTLYMGEWTMIAAGVGALRARRERAAMFFTAAAVIFFLMALGRYSPLYRALFSAAPFLTFLRYPEKYLHIVTLSLAFLAALGTTDLIPASKKRLGVLMAGSIFMPVFVLPGILPWLQDLAVELIKPLVAESQSGLPAHEAWKCLGSALSMFGVTVYLSTALIYWAEEKKEMLAGAAVLLILLIGLFHANRVFVPHETGAAAIDSPLAKMIIEREKDASDAGRLKRPSSIDPRYLARIGLGRFRIVRDPYIASPDPLDIFIEGAWERETLRPNLGVMEGFEYLGSLNIVKTARQKWMGENVLTLYLMPLYNVKYAIVDGKAAPQLGNDLVPVGFYKGAALMEFKEYFPRAYWIGGAWAVRGKAELAARFESTDFKRTVLLEDCADPGPALGSVMIPMKIASYSPDRVEVEADAPSGGWLVLNDAFYPGWRAQVNGAEATIYRANGLVRAVKVEAGKSAVIFTYHPPGLWLGLISSFAAAALALGLVLKGRR